MFPRGELVQTITPGASKSLSSEINFVKRFAKLRESSLFDALDALAGKRAQL